MIENPMHQNKKTLNDLSKSLVRNLKSSGEGIDSQDVSFPDWTAVLQKKNCSSKKNKSLKLSGRLCSSRSRTLRRNKSTLYLPARSILSIELTSKSLDGGMRKMVDTMKKRKSMKPNPPKFQNETSHKEKTQIKISSDDLEWQRVIQEKEKQDVEIRNTKKLYAFLKKKEQQKLNSQDDSFDTNNNQNVVQKKPLTVPQTPNFLLNKRLGKRETILEKKLVSNLETKHEVYEKPKLTLVEPFQFATDKRFHSEVSSNSMTEGPSLLTSEAISQFIKSARVYPTLPNTVCKQLTIAHSPKLRTVERSKSASRMKPMSWDTKEHLEMEEIMKHPFKARPVDQRVFQSMGELGVPKVESKGPTEPMEFDFKYPKRLSMLHRQSKVSQPMEESFVSFKALPLPTFEPVQAIVHPNDFKPTIPISPKLSGKERASSAPIRRQRPHHSLVDESINKVKPLVQKLKVTEPKEFHLETESRGMRYQENLIEKFAKAETIAKEENRIRAIPIPNGLKNPFHVQPIKHEGIEVVPFTLRSVQRHSEAMEVFQREVSDMERKVKENEFHARPIPKTTYEPVVMERKGDELHPLVMPSAAMRLESDERAIKRREFDESISKKMMELDQMKKDLEKNQLIREGNRVKELRRMSIAEGGMMFKAQPVQTEDKYPSKTGKTVPVLTQPKSPVFASKQRRNKSMQGLENQGNHANEQGDLVNETGKGLKGKPRRRMTTSVRMNNGHIKSVFEPMENKSKLQDEFSNMIQHGI